MTVTPLEDLLQQKLDKLKATGVCKGKEKVITGIKPAEGKNGPRYFLAGYGEKAFLRLNSNSYLGLSLKAEIIAAEEAAVRQFGTGPGAVRFISGTYSPHVELEKKLAAFHKREAAMIFSSAYAAVMGVIAPLIDSETIIISDELNHNCIINAIRLAKPKEKHIFRHLDMTDLEEKIKKALGKGRWVLIVTDGIFSMRGDYAPLDEIGAIAARYEPQFEGGVNTLVDDSHGVGAFGQTGRGTEEYTRAQGIDMIVATLGKALGVNGGYIVSSATIVEYLRETAPFYIYSNPITPAEAGAAIKALEIIDSEQGRQLLERLRRLTKRFEQGLVALGYEIIASEHPVVPLMIRDTQKTSQLVDYLTASGILATGLNYPVVPKGDEEIRFQVAADHTEGDIDYVLEVLKRFKGQ
ncbi:MAG: aminotransferase class I/II-fold pyridoxal phosphate-dependent enzyme [Candidatus Marinimicrobia bacterium]|nr:aminotransferase class I/II-fold pyridoxal phosphate-dependent enzyme [Candidatus Neomarinimicrobiota bacterium]